MTSSPPRWRIHSTVSAKAHGGMCFRALFFPAVIGSSLPQVSTSLRQPPPFTIHLASVRSDTRARLTIPLMSANRTLTRFNGLSEFARQTDLLVEATAEWKERLRKERSGRHSRPLRITFGRIHSGVGDSKRGEPPRQLVLPVYNGANFIRRAVRSIQRNLGTGELLMRRRQPRRLAADLPGSKPRILGSTSSRTPQRGIAATLIVPRGGSSTRSRNRTILRFWSVWNGRSPSSMGTRRPASSAEWPHGWETTRRSSRTSPGSCTRGDPSPAFGKISSSSSMSSSPRSSTRRRWCG